MTSSRLRHCPYCQQTWPKGNDHDLRGFAWLDPLPRSITISNGDLILHDGAHGRDRFLAVETKTPWEPVTQTGQGWLLRALARQSGWTVRLLKGTLSRLIMHRVTSDGIDPDGLLIPHAAFRAATVDFLNGQPWRDPTGPAAERIPTKSDRHTCGFARVDDVWTCVQDFYATGFAPETGCGATWAAA